MFLVLEKIKYTVLYNVLFLTLEVDVSVELPKASFALYPLRCIETLHWPHRHLKYSQLAGVATLTV